MPDRLPRGKRPTRGSQRPEGKLDLLRLRLSEPRDRRERRRYNVPPFLLRQLDRLQRLDSFWREHAHKLSRSDGGGRDLPPLLRTFLNTRVDVNPVLVLSRDGGARGARDGV